MRLHTCFSIIGLAFLLSLDLSAQTVRVIFVSGHAELQRPDEAAAHPAQKGESVIIGTRITTGPDGRVVLTPMPGVKSMIAPNTTIVLESASDSHPSPTEVTHQATLNLKVGAVVSDLQKQEGVTYDYSIRTPRGLAGARGTTFTVGLNEAGIQTIIVSHGTITLSLADGRQVSLTIGQVSITQPGGTTEHGGKVSDLSPADQALAAKWVKTTLETLSEAVESGIKLQSTALSNALDTAKSLGISVPAELQQRVENLISQQPETKTGTGTDTTTTTNKDTTEIITASGVTIPPNLTAEQLAIFTSLSADAQDAINELNDPDITTVALTPSVDTGLPLTNADIIRHLIPLIALKNNDPASYALFKELAGAITITTAAITTGPTSGGTGLPNIDNAPDPAQWSASAFARASAMWNSTASDALTFLQKQQIVSLGAGEIVMDRSASYLSALLDAFNTLPYGEQNALVQAGWGKYLADIANNPTKLSLQSAVITISGYTPDQISLLKEFGIAPQELLTSENNGHPVGDLLIALGNTTLISATDLITLRQLGARNNLLNAYSNNGNSGAVFVSFLSTSLAFYDGLTDAQKVAVRALGVGDVLLYHSPSDIIGYGSGQVPIYISDRITELANFYISLSGSDQQSVRDMRLFDSMDSSVFILGTALNVPLLQSTITTYQDLQPRTRDYLASEGKNYSFLSLYLGTTTSGPSVMTSLSSTSTIPITPVQPSFRSLAQIDDLLNSLTTDEYATLLDLDGAKAIFETGHLGDTPNDTGITTALANLKTFVDFYSTDLGPIQKSTLRELGIVGNGNIAFLGADPADHTGLSRLLTAYSGLSGSLRAATERFDETMASGSHFGNSINITDRSYFFPYGETEVSMTNVSFEAAGDLYVGATKYLVIDDTNDSNVSFTVASGGDLALRASNLIDLTSTTFSAGVRTITMEAATINLTSINFPGGAGVYLNSKLGGTSDGATGTGAYPHFGSSAVGRVNFISGVSYNGNSINNTATFDSYGGNIHLGTLTSPVIAPPKPSLVP